MATDKFVKLRSSDFYFSLNLLKFLITFRSYTIMHFLILIVFNCLVMELKGAFDKKEVGASSFALGNAAVGIDHYLFAIYYNPAALSTEFPFQTAFSYQNFFGIGELNAVDLMINFKLSGHPFSFAINRFGNGQYQEVQITAASRYEIVETCAIGISVQNYILAIQKYGQAVAWGINFSALYKLLPELSIGALVTNLNRPVISEAREKLPQTMSLGFCYYPVPDLMMSFEFFQDIRFDQEYRAGCSYRVISFLTIRAGIEDQLNIYSYGLGVNINWIDFDYSLRNHPVLGISHIITFSLVL